jgi:two-component system, response regulator PdtaR
MSIIVKTDVTIASSTTSVAFSTHPADRSILIVEDNRFVARQCRSALLAGGFKVIGIVATADDAIQMALETRPRLNLMDIYLLGERDRGDAAIEIFQRCGIRSIFASAPADAAAKARAEAAQPLAWLPSRSATTGSSRRWRPRLSRSTQISDAPFLDRPRQNRGRGMGAPKHKHQAARRWNFTMSLPTGSLRRAPFQRPA